MNSFMKIAAMFVVSSPLALAGCMAGQAQDEMEQSVSQAEQASDVSGGAIRVTEGEEGALGPNGGGAGCEAPNYGAPTIQAPSYPAPSYGAPRHAAPIYKAPVYQSPTYQAPSETPAFGAPTYSAPSYQGPTFGAPVYEAPSYDAPTFYAPIFEGPTYLPANQMLPANPSSQCSMQSNGAPNDNP